LYNYTGEVGGATAALLAGGLLDVLQVVLCMAAQVSAFY